MKAKEKKELNKIRAKEIRERYYALIDEIRECKRGGISQVTSTGIYILGWNDGYNARKYEKAYGMDK